MSRLSAGPRRRALAMAQGLRRRLGAPPPASLAGQPLSSDAAANLFTALAAGAVAAWMFSAGGGPGWANWLFGAGLLILAGVDIRRFLLPDLLTVPLLLAGLAVAHSIHPADLPQHLIGAFAGFGAFVLFGHAYRLLRGRDGLGLGDAKLIAAIGAWVSWQGLASVVFVAALTALAWTLLERVRGRPVRWDDRLPFGAYLAFAAWLVWIYGPITIGGGAG